MEMHNCNHCLLYLIMKLDVIAIILARLILFGYGCYLEKRPLHHNFSLFCAREFVRTYK